MHAGSHEDLLPTCPFCDYKPSSQLHPDTAAYQVTHHVEIMHREQGTGRSPFDLTDNDTTVHRRPLDAGSRSTAQPGSSSSSSPSSSIVDIEAVHGSPDSYVDCPQRCGEVIPMRMLEQHLHLHQAEDLALNELDEQNDDARPASQQRVRQGELEESFVAESVPRKPAGHGKGILRGIFGFPSATGKAQRKSNAQASVKRLGRKELGPHAYEEKMPSWLLRQLQEGPPISWVNQIGPDGRLQRIERVANETPGLVPALADLCRQDRAVSKAWFCSPGAKHIFKMRREGGFCGYRNIQMQISWMQHHRHPGFEHFGESTPNILDLQSMIEDAWQSGINSSGKAETGGIIGTRKYIGTPEAQALFQHLGIACNAQAFTKNRLGDRRDPVYTMLLEYVLEYYSKDVDDPTQKVYTTNLPPIYFQHPGHSLTIVGIEVLKNGDINLLVFDPMFPTVSAMMHYLGTGATVSNPSKVLKSFRRGTDYVKKFKSFEVLSLACVATTNGRNERWRHGEVPGKLANA